MGTCTIRIFRNSKLDNTSHFIIIQRNPFPHQSIFEILHIKLNLQGVLTVFNTGRVCTYLSYVDDPDPKADTQQVGIPYRTMCTVTKKLKKNLQNPNSKMNIEKISYRPRMSVETPLCESKGPIKSLELA